MTLFESISSILSLGAQALKKTASALIDACIFLLLLPCNVLTIAALASSSIPILGSILAFPLGAFAIASKVIIKQLESQLKYWFIDGEPVAPLISQLDQMLESQGRMTGVAMLPLVVLGTIVRFFEWTLPSGWEPKPEPRPEPGTPESSGASLATGDAEAAPKPTPPAQHSGAVSRQGLRF